MLFTSASVPFRTQPSPLFKEKGDLNGYPGTCQQSGIISTSDSNLTKWNMFIANIPNSIVAKFTKEVSSLGNFPVHAIGDLDLPIGYPQVGVAFDKPSEETIDKLKALGMVDDAHGKFRYFRGTLTANGAASMSLLRPNERAFVPSGVADFTGLQAHIITTRVLRAVISSINTCAYAEMSVPAPLPLFFRAKDEDKHIGVGLVETGKRVDRTLFTQGKTTFPVASVYGEPLGFIPRERKYIFTSASDVGHEGVFAPYFPGLLLPDKDFTPRFIISNFKTLLGKNPSDQMAVMKLLLNGWSTLASTPQGLILQHISFCLKLAMDCGAMPSLLIKHGSEYQGTIFEGASIHFLSKGIWQQSLNVEELKKEVSMFDSHDEAIHQIGLLLASIPLEEEDSDGNKQFISVEDDLLTSPRLIHNLLRRMKPSMDDRTKLRVQFDRTSFTQTFFDAKNPNDIITAFKHLGRAEFLSDNAPMSIRSDAMFTKEHDLSTLSAFGAIGPSLFDPSGNALPILRNNSANQKKYGTEGVFIHHRLNQDKSRPELPRNEIPVYLKAVGDALQDYRSLKKSHAISFRITPRGGCAGAGYLLKGESADRMAKLLATHFSPSDVSVKLKRKRDVEDMTKEELDDIAKNSRTKRQKMTTAYSLFNDIPAAILPPPRDQSPDDGVEFTGVAPEGEMEMEEEEE
jgi:hypothetical protein